MDKIEYTVTRITTEDLERLRELALKNKRSMLQQLSVLLDNAENISV